MCTRPQWGQVVGSFPRLAMRVESWPVQVASSRLSLDGVIQTCVRIARRRDQDEARSVRGVLVAARRVFRCDGLGENDCDAVERGEGLTEFLDPGQRRLHSQAGPE